MNAEADKIEETGAVDSAPAQPSEPMNPMRALLLAIRRSFQAGQFDRTEILARRLAGLRPNHHYPLQMLGIVANERDDLGAAMGLLRRAVSMRPDNHLIRLNLGLVYLKMGQFAQGWADYEHRFSLVRGRDRQHVSLPDLKFPRWQGEDLNGKRLLLVREQGFGDQIQFVRYAEILARQGAVVDMLVRPPAERLMRTAKGVGRVLVEPVPEDESWDYWCPIMSLPGLLGTDLTDLPAQTPYLSADPVEVERWEKVIAAHAQGRPRIGVAWTGNVGHVRNGARSVSFAAMDSLARAHPDLAFISLQVGKHEEAAKEKAAADCPILFLGREEGGDFAEAAAVIDCVDLVVGIDTSTPHLAGALGVPAWVLLHCGCDWRWLRYRSDSPWYPHHRLFRQSRRNSWEDVLAAISQALGRRDFSLRTD